MSAGTFAVAAAAAVCLAGSKYPPVPLQWSGASRGVSLLAAVFRPSLDEKVRGALPVTAVSSRR